MIETPQIIQTSADHTAVIHLTVPRQEIHKVMGPAMQEVLATVAAQGATRTGPLFAHHLRMQPDIFDLEVGVPVHAPFTPVGRVIASSLPATRAARTVYRGGYHGLGAAWGAFDRWLQEQQHRAAADLVERYARGPESSSNPDDWQTELIRPLAD